MGVMNNLVLFDQHKPQNSLDTIVPDLADSWNWSEDGKQLTFKLKEGVKWHDGKPFSARDVKCTFDLLQGKGGQKLRLNPRGGWYHNVEEVTVNGDQEVVVNLKRPQPALLALLASGYTPIYPCHVPPAQMRTHPIGTGPFKFVEYKQNESIKLVRNPDYFRQGLPYLDAVDYTIISNRSTAVLGFAAGKFDMTFPTEISVPLIKDVKSQAPQAICELVPTAVSTNLLINRDKPPFDTPEIRRAMMLTLDRKAFKDILSEGKAGIGGAMLPQPEGVWGLPQEELAKLPGYGPDIEKNREEARAIMKKLGYGPDKLLNVKVATRNIASYRDAAVILIDQLKHVYIAGELEPVETANWFPKVARKDYQIGLNLTGSSVDDPDQQFYENYACGSQRNYSGYCSKEIDQLVDQQSAETDQNKRRQIVYEIDRRLQEDAARPIIVHGVSATCWYPHVKNVTLHTNSIYNGWRMEDWWLNKGEKQKAEAGK
jgi:peptide/nickel transport system substrate-binding protein